MNKPVVYFNESLVRPVKGARAVVRIVSEHPKLGFVDAHFGVVTTSQVQEVCEDGAFETLNTVYRPAFYDQTEAALYSALR